MKVLNRIKLCYNSTNAIGHKKEFPTDSLERIREYLQEKVPQEGKLTKGQLQDLLLDYREPDGSRLMINQLEPIFVKVAYEGRVWDKYL